MCVCVCGSESTAHDADRSKEGQRMGSGQNGNNETIATFNIFEQKTFLFCFGRSFVDDLEGEILLKCLGDIRYGCSAVGQLNVVYSHCL